MVRGGTGSRAGPMLSCPRVFRSADRGRLCYESFTVTVLLSV